MRTVILLAVLLLASSASAQTLYQIDSGVNLPGVTHGPDFTGGNGVDCYGHGTAMATVSGVPASRIVSVRVFDCNGVGDYYEITAAMRWVRDNAVQGDLVLMPISYGPTPWDYLTDWDEAIEASTNNGVTWVVSAGNRNDWTFFYTPSRVEVAVVVGAADGLHRAPYSSFGPQMDLYADGCSLGWCGTSVSAALVAGDVFDLLTLYPWAPPAHVINILTGSCTATMITPGPGTTSCKR